MSSLNSAKLKRGMSGDKDELVIVRIGDVRFDWDDTALPNLAAKALGLK